jgi:acyl-CoA dehydrogenase
VGYIVGEENRGLEYMFIMMNEARYAVGMEGLALAERATQQAVAYARDRVQGTEAGVRSGQKVAIIRHPDVRRMLMTMRCLTEAMRALAYVVAGATDIAHRHPDAGRREGAQSFVDLMIPVVKGWFTENAVTVASIGVQVHGGMGYIEETGAAQHLRDARITTIYEGTTAIQANDLIGRKVARDGGLAVRGVLGEMRGVVAALEQGNSAHFGAIAVALTEAIAAVESAVEYLVATYGRDIRAASVGSVPFLELLGIVSGGWQMARAALAAQGNLKRGSGEAAFYTAKIVTARFYADHVLSRAMGLAHTVVHGAEGALALPDDAF